MNEISQRIQALLDYYNLTAGSFAQKLGIQKSSVSHLLSGRNKPSYQFLNKLAKAFPQVNLNWFITGTGEMIENAIDAPKIKKDISTSFSENSPIAENKELNKVETKKLAQERKLVASSNEVDSIIMVYDNDTFKILKKA